MTNVNQGELWWVNPTPKMGHEQQGRRPALVVQNDLANHYLGTTIIALISSSNKKRMPEMVPLEEAEGLKKESFADFSQIFTIDKVRLEKKIGMMRPEKWDLVEQALGRIFLKTLDKRLNQ